MKKTILFLCFGLFSLTAYTQNNYAGSSLFSDNFSITFQGGMITPFTNSFKDGSTSPALVLGIDKYVTPGLGIGIEGRTFAGVGENFNNKTVLDAINLSGYLKLNLANLFDFNGMRKAFEPVLYTGLGWGHFNPSFPNNYPLDDTHTSGTRNFMTYRAGMELIFNGGFNRRMAFVINPSVVWGNICNGYLKKHNGSIEITAGVVYHFRTSNGTHSFTKPMLYDQAYVDDLIRKIDELECNPTTINNITNVFNEVYGYGEHKFAVCFTQNSSQLSPDAKQILDLIPVGSVVDIAGSTSPEGTVERNTELAEERAEVVAEYLMARGVKVESACGGSAGRAAVITIRQ